MADLNDKNRSEPTRVVGADPTTGEETNFLVVTENNDAQTNDRANTTGVYAEILVGTTPVPLRVGVANLDERKFAHAFPKDKNIFWGYNSSVTVTTGTKIFKDTFAGFKVGPAIDVYLVAATNNNKTNIGELA